MTQNRDNQISQKSRLRSFTRGSVYRDLTGKIFVFLDRCALIGGGRLREAVAHGDLTVFSC